MKRLIALMLFLLTLCACTMPVPPQQQREPATYPTYDGQPYGVMNDNEPLFGPEDMTTDSFETYSSLDSLGRCGAAYACVGLDLMPTEPRQSISRIKPTGWHSVQYDTVDGKSLYNRCHLIGFQLTGENDNERNLITGTRYLNVEGMLPFENMVADYVKETGNHVLYRVTPVFEGDDLVARGVTLEGWSVEDEGDGVCFYVYCFNVQPTVQIDYATGDSWLASQSGQETATYVLNTNTKKFHRVDCTAISDISKANSQQVDCDRKVLLEQGYEPCKRCDP